MTRYKARSPAGGDDVRLKNAASSLSDRLAKCRVGIEIKHEQQIWVIQNLADQSADCASTLQ